MFGSSFEILICTIGQNFDSYHHFVQATVPIILNEKPIHKKSRKTKVSSETKKIKVMIAWEDAK